MLRAKNLMQYHENLTAAPSAEPRSCDTDHAEIPARIADLQPPYQSLAFYVLGLEHVTQRSYFVTLQPHTVRTCLMYARNEAAVELAQACNQQEE